MSFQTGDRVSVQRPSHPLHERVGTVRGLGSRGSVMVHFDGEPLDWCWPTAPQDLEQVPWKD